MASCYMYLILTITSAVFVLHGLPSTDGQTPPPRPAPPNTQLPPQDLTTREGCRNAYYYGTAVSGCYINATELCTTRCVCTDFREYALCHFRAAILHGDYNKDDYSSYDEEYEDVDILSMQSILDFTLQMNVKQANRYPGEATDPAHITPLMRMYERGLNSSCAFTVNELYEQVTKGEVQPDANRLAHGDVMKLNPTGRINGGVAQSHADVKYHLPYLKPMRECFLQAGDDNGIQPSVIAALASKESGGGSLLAADGTGDRGRAWGILQCDFANSGLDCRACEAKSCCHIKMMVKNLLVPYIERVARKKPSWTKEQALQGGVAAYNFGVGNVWTWENLDVGTEPTPDYSNDVMARAQYLHGLGWDDDDVCILEEGKGGQKDKTTTSTTTTTSTSTTSTTTSTTSTTTTSTTSARPTAGTTETARTTVAATISRIFQTFRNLFQRFFGMFFSG